MEPDPVEIRVLGCLIEKQRTTPDAYPLSLNALRLACNQSTNRDPVVKYDEATIRKALGELGRRRWIRSASGHTSRAAKYRHLLKDELTLPEDQLSLLGVLVLRGAQTPGELKQRVERLHHFDSLGRLHEALDAMIGRELVRRLPRRPGQKEERYEQRLGRSAGEGEDHEPEGRGDEAPVATGEEPVAAPSRPGVHTAELSVSTQGDADVVDITAEVRQIVGEVEGAVQALAFVRGSTAAIATMEFEPGGVHDLREMLERLIPTRGDYEHNRLNHDTNSHAHQRASIVGPSEAVPVVEGRLALGTWQQLVLIDFDDRPRERTVVVQVLG